MWQDTVLYWAWRGPIPENGLPPSPTQKRIAYADITLPSGGQMQLATTVFDDDTPTEVNRVELEGLRRIGATVKEGRL